MAVCIDDHEQNCFRDHMKATVCDVNVMRLSAKRTSEWLDTTIYRYLECVHELVIFLLCSFFIYRNVDVESVKGFAVTVYVSSLCGHKALQLVGD